MRNGADRLGQCIQIATRFAAIAAQGSQRANFADHLLCFRLVYRSKPQAALPGKFGEDAAGREKNNRPHIGVAAKADQHFTDAACHGLHQKAIKRDVRSRAGHAIAHHRHLFTELRFCFDTEAHATHIGFVRKLSAKHLQSKRKGKFDIIRVAFANRHEGRRSDSLFGQTQIGSPFVDELGIACDGRRQGWQRPGG